jgi:D-apionolactonase
MATAPSREIIYFGTEEPVVAPRLVRAGPVSARLDAGNLRWLRVGETEILRAVQFIVRDRNWGTYSPQIDNLQIDEAGDSFRISYDAVCADAGQRLSYSTVIEGSPDRISFRVDGRTESRFVTNRTGFVVLHAESVAGLPVRVTHTDGRVEDSRFPELIDPKCPFMDIRTLAHEPAPGLRVSVTMLGDAFEMEDQRNWSDASYKTYIRPLAEPWPYELAEGERLEQSVTVDISAASAVRAVSGGAAAAIPVRIDTAGWRQLPRLGLAVAPGDIAGALAQVDLVRRIRPDHLVAHVDLRAEPGAQLIRDYGALAAAVDARIVLECVLPALDSTGKPTSDATVLQRDVDRLAALVSEAGVSPDLVTAVAACDLKSTLPGSVFPACPDQEEISRALKGAFPDVPLGGGMITYFTELNRKRPPTGPIDFITHTTSPLVHAGDDLSVMESLQALPAIMKSTLAIAEGLPYRIGPTAIGMRMNPYGAKTADNPKGGRVAMAFVDPRQRGLMAPAWAIGYYAHALAHGVEAVCLDAPTGPFGAIYTKQDWPQPWFDDPANGARVYPVFHALAGIGAAAGSAMPVTTGAPTKLLGFADLRTAGGTDLWLANVTGEDQRVSLAGTGAPESIALIDETSFVALCTDLDGLDRLAGPVGGEVVTLRPYATARIRLRR